MKLLPDSKIAYLTKKLNACVGIISKLLISPPRHGRYWAVKPIALPGDNSPKKNSCKGNFTLGARGFSCAVSGFAARVFCQRPKTCRPAADEAPVTRENKPLVPRVGKLVFKKNPATGDT